MLYVLILNTLYNVIYMNYIIHINRYQYSDSLLDSNTLSLNSFARESLCVFKPYYWFYIQSMEKKSSIFFIDIFLCNDIYQVRNRKLKLKKGTEIRCCVCVRRWIITGGLRLYKQPSYRHR